MFPFDRALSLRSLPSLGQCASFESTIISPLSLLSSELSGFVVS